MISPKPDKQNGRIDLKDWADAILKALLHRNWELPIQFQRMGLATGIDNCRTMQLVDEAATMVAGIDRLENVYGDEDNRRNAAWLWRTTFGGDDQTKWTALNTLLTGSGSSGGIRASDKMIKGEMRSEAPKLNNVGNIELPVDVNQGWHVDGIYTDSHSELAVLLEYDRANRILAQLDQKPPSSSPSQAPAQQRGAPTGPAEQSAAPGGPSYPAASDETEAQFKDKINVVRQARLDGFYEGLKANFERGRIAFENCMKSDGQTDPAKCVCTDDDFNLGSKKQSDLIPTEGRSAQIQEKLDAGVNAHGYVNTPQSVATVTSPAECKSAELCEQVGQDFFAVQTNAVLARLYCLAFDLTVNLADPRNAAAVGMLLQIADRPPADAAERAVLQIWMKPEDPAQASGDLTGLGGADSPATLTTLATALMGGQELQEPGFWAATREEMIHALTGSNQPVENVVSQIDGYQLAGREGAYRFEMTSLDVRAAVEHEYMKRLSMPPPDASAPASDGDPPTPLTDAASPPEANANGGASLSPSPDPVGADAVFRTDGLVILDRALQIEKARALARRERMITDQAQSARQVLYAEDLTTGYRLDVAIPRPRGPSWTPLNMRIVNYGMDGQNVPMNPIVHNLLKQGVAGPLDEADRVNMDSSIITAPERMIPADHNSNAPRMDLAVTENLITWQGQPLGVDASKLLWASDDRLDDEADDLSTSGLAFTRRLFLPLRDHRWSGDRQDPLRGLPEHTELEEYLPPRLRYGWPYCFALRVVYSGGRSVPLAQISATSTRRKGRAVFPPSCKGEPRYFRFLRQRGIGPPVVLLPAEEAVNATGNRMGVAENETVILRSVSVEGIAQEAEDVTDRASPATASRIVVPPRIDLDEAALHGAFDAAPTAVPGGAFTRFDLREVDGVGYFPVAERQVIRGMNGALLPFKGWSSSTPTLVAPSQPDPAAAKAMLDGQIVDVRTVFSGPIYNVNGQGQNRGAYYPDPFAQTLVLRMRHADRVDGPELIHHLPIYPSATHENMTDLTWAKSVRLNFRKSQNQTMRISCNDCSRTPLESIADLLAFPQVGAGPDPTSGDRDPQIYIYLPAGNSFDLDLWYVPTEKDLQGKSAVVQAMAVIKAGSKSSDTDCGANSAACKKPFVAPGGVEVPPRAQVEEMAKQLHKALLRAPITGVTSVTTLRCVHATNDARDSLVINPDEGAPLLFHRAGSSEYDCHVSACGDQVRRTPYIVADSADSLLDGDIALDLNRISGFDILARSVDPSTETLDDISRARNLSARRDGTWPTLRDWGGRSFLKNARQIFGFDLAEDGTVAVPKVDFVLYRIRNLPSGLDASDTLCATAKTEGKTIIRLFKLLALADREPGGVSDLRWKPIRVTRVQHFAGTLGREVELVFSPIPRTLSELGKPDHYDGIRHILREDFPPELVLGATGKQCCPLPCSSRPAIPVVQGITYVFHWRGTGTPDDPRIRETRIRIYLERGWFSKSDTERVGLVLWPPAQDQQAHISKDLVTNQRLPEPRSGPTHAKDRYINRILLPGSWTGGAREFQYLDYNDDDLGPNGRYVTRMGADPIKESAFSARAFIGKDDFSLFGATFGARGGGVEMISQATLPAPEAGETTGELDVSLLTVAPKFHAEHEKWYVDIAFPREFSTVEPFIRFGIVRYASDAPVKLQVSSPVAFWAKVMPNRTLVATLSQDGLLSVKLSGAALALPVLPGDEGTEHGAPAVYALLMAERVVDGQVVARRELLPTEASTAPRGRHVRPARAQAWLHLEPSGDKSDSNANAWQILRRYEDPIGRMAADERLVVHVQEVDRMRPSDYPNEPVDPQLFETRVYDPTNTDDYLVETGPRFAGNVVVAGQALVCDEDLR